MWHNRNLRIRYVGLANNYTAGLGPADVNSTPVPYPRPRKWELPLLQQHFAPKQRCHIHRRSRKTFDSWYPKSRTKVRANASESPLLISLQSSQEGLVGREFGNPIAPHQQSPIQRSSSLSASRRATSPTGGSWRALIPYRVDRLQRPRGEQGWVSPTSHDQLRRSVSEAVYFWRTCRLFVSYKRSTLYCTGLTSRQNPT